MDRAIRARVLMSEAQALGLDVEDLVAAATGAPRAARPAVPTVSEYIVEVTPTLAKGRCARTGPTGASPRPTSATSASTP